MHHGTEFGVVILISLVLCAGALVRLAASHIRLPYTIAMLLLGLAVGAVLGLPAVGLDALLARAADPEGHLGAFESLLVALGSGMRVHPDLIIFCFLPALVFESAFAIDLHTFKKTVGPAILFAGPALLVATAATGALLYALLPLAGWEWEAAFVTFGAGRDAIVEHGALLATLYFGALISATDPVAVVALLRELGVSKKMAHLIEGESLLNDGTAIVVSGVLLELVMGRHFHGVGNTLLHFVVVVVGGLVVGWLLALLASWLMGATFNDAMVEITTTIILGYAAMWVAEGLLHVSGVMALVAAGLWLGGPARTKVSPEVSHFLHQFWELLAYLANTLIFFLVGMIIGTKLNNATVADVFVILAMYVGIMAIRYVVTLSFRPLANLTGDPISRTDVLVVSWGGLRGAVSMALVLAVATNPLVPPLVSEKMLLLTAGVVLLTIGVNGMTMGPLLAKLGYDQPPLAEALAGVVARVGLLDRVMAAIEAARAGKDLRTVNWTQVRAGVQQRRDELGARAQALSAKLQEVDEGTRVAGYWHQALGVERQAYWRAFGAGMLGARAVKALDAEINSHLDRIARGQLDVPATRTPAASGPAAALLRSLRESEALAGLYASVEFDNLAHQYDAHRAVAGAASHVLAALEAISAQAPSTGASIRATYERYLAESKQALEEMRLGMPEITAAIEARLAERIALNIERAEIETLAHEGVFDAGSAHHLAAEVEERMQRLRMAATRATLPALDELVAQVPLFAGLEDAHREKVAEVSRIVVVGAGEYVFRQGDRGDAMYVIVRGAMHVTVGEPGRERMVDVLGGGEMIGEMALLTGEPRTANALCATAVTLVRIGRDGFAALMGGSRELSMAVWRAFAHRRFDNHLSGIAAWRHLGHAERCAWIGGGEWVEIEASGRAALDPACHWAFVVAGAVQHAGREVTAPALLDLHAGHDVTARDLTRVVVLPRLAQVHAA